MASNNRLNYSFTNSDLVELNYSEIELNFLITKLTTDNTKLITSYIDNNNVAIIKLNNSTNKYLFIDLSYSFNKLFFDVVKNVRYDANSTTYPFNLRLDLYDDRVSGLIVSLTDQNINQLLEYIQYPNIETPILGLNIIYSMIIDYTPVFTQNNPTFKNKISIDGAVPSIDFIDGSNTDWKLGLDNTQNLRLLRGGTENVLSVGRDTGSITLSKGLTINNPSPALILTGTVGSNTISGGMQSINGEVSVASFSNNAISFILNGSNPNMYKIATFKTNKSMDLNGSISINKSTTGTPVFSTDDSTSSTSVWGELYKKNPSRLSCSCNTFTFNIPTNTPTIIPFNQILTQQGSKVSLNTTTGLITLSEIGMYHLYFVWAPNDVVNTRINASYIIRNPVGQVSTGPTTWSNNGSSVSLSNTIYIASAPSTIEFTGMHYLGSNMRLATSTSVGAYWTYAAVMFLY